MSVVMNNPRELGGREIGLIEGALQNLVDISDGKTKIDAQDLLDLVKDSHTVWLDLNE